MQHEVMIAHGAQQKVVLQKDKQKFPCKSCRTENCEQKTVSRNLRSRHMCSRKLCMIDSPMPTTAEPKLQDSHEPNSVS